MECDNDNELSNTAEPYPAKTVCRECNSYVEKEKCKCPGPPRGRGKKIAGESSSSTSEQLLNGRRLLKHTKTKTNVSNVPDSTVRLRPSSQTKSKGISWKETKLQLSHASVGKECLKYDKEAVNVPSNIGSESTAIFENDFDCVDSMSIDRQESSQMSEERKLQLERTPVKAPAPSRTEPPAAPSKAIATSSGETPKTPSDHREYSARPPRHMCPFCSKTFRSNGKLNSHVYTHTGERPFACKHCHKAFSSKFKLVRHLLIHSEDRKFLCTVCERRFLRNDHLKNHYKVHDPRKEVFRCERAGCEKEYSSALSQRKHEAWHRAQDGDLTCLLCGVKHEATGDLLLHLRRHSGSRLIKSPADRKFRCHVCERHFLTRKDVTRHLVVHTGERDFLCQFCPQRFGRKDHLVRHIKKSHSSAKRKVNKSILTLNKSKKSGRSEDSNVDMKDEDTSDIDDDLRIDETSRESESSLGEGPSTSAADDPLEVLPVLSPGSGLLGPECESAVTLDDEMNLMPSEASMDLFDFPSTSAENFVTPSQDESLVNEANRRLAETHERKGGDLFEGTSQSLMFGEPTFDDEELKPTDLMLNNQGEPSGELLRYLLQTDPDAPLPGFSQIFNPCPPSSS